MLAGSPLLRRALWAGGGVVAAGAAALVALISGVTASATPTGSQDAGTSGQQLPNDQQVPGQQGPFGQDGTDQRGGFPGGLGSVQGGSRQGPVGGSHGS